MDAVDICSFALNQLGEHRVTELNQENPESDAEEACVVNFPLAVAAALESREWTFATGWLKLENPQPGVHPLDKKRFLLPATVLRVVGVDDGTGLGVLPHKKEGRYVSADVDVLYVRAIQIVENPEEWSPNFGLAVGFLLASLMAVPLTESKGMRDTMAEEYRKQLRDAAALDGMQGTAERQKHVGPRPSDRR